MTWAKIRPPLAAVKLRLFPASICGSKSGLEQIFNSTVLKADPSSKKKPISVLGVKICCDIMRNVETLIFLNFRQLLSRELELTAVLYYFYLEQISH